MGRWSTSREGWRGQGLLARLPRLGPDKTSFIFKIIHQILPTQERVACTKPRASPSCKMQSCQGEAEENLPHALVYCQANDRVGMKLYECLREIQPSLEVEAVLRLELEVEDKLELPVVWLIRCGLGYLWNLRQQKFQS